MKAEVSSQGAESGTAAATELAKPRGTREQSVTTEEPAAGDDEFKEIPTVANRALPTADEVREASSSGSAQQEGIGTYRLLRPAVSDSVDPPVSTTLDTRRHKGVVLGTARKPR